jgi:predicted nucleic acid-binding protein
MLVVDASAVAELVLARPAAKEIERLIRSHGYELHAPHLLDIEVLSALRRVVAAGEATAYRACEAVEDLLDLPVERYPHDVLVPRVWELRENFSAYDAAYLALAESLIESGAPLLTADARFARAVESHSSVHPVLVD